MQKFATPTGHPPTGHPPSRNRLLPSPLFTGIQHVLCGALLGILLAAPQLNAQEPAAKRDVSLLDKSNLVAWCIVPFDAKHRSPAERAQMLEDLGILRCAYDWRDEHVATFEEEILEYQKHGIEFFAFWHEHPEAFELFEKYDLHPQIWRSPDAPTGDTQAERVESVAQALIPLAERTQQLDCPLGLYNHGGWQGEPNNLVAVCQRLRDLGFAHVGIVYNFHHAHDQIANWSKAFAAMQPYLLCLNINGMNDNENPKILGLGQGQHELDMLKVVIDGGYDGPIGILDHREQLDSRISLEENLRGVEWLKRELQDPGSGGPRPEPVAPEPAVSAEDQARMEAGLALQGGMLYPGQDTYAESPLTMEAQARFAIPQGYNILVANETKASATHWEVFSENGSGLLTAYMPGMQPDHIRSGVMICDNQPHRIGMIWEPERVRLFVDGEAVADEPLEFTGRSRIPGGLGIGRLAEGGFNFAGQIDWVHISQGVRDLENASGEKPARDDQTLGDWDFTSEEASPVDEESSPDLSEVLRGLAPSSSNIHSGPLEVSATEFDPQQVETLLEAAQSTGDAARGAQVFASARSACISCHRVNGQGGSVGPELTEIAKTREPRQLVESLLWPKREVKPEFTAWQVLTVDGRVFHGYRQESSDQKMHLIEPATGVTHEIDASQIELEKPAGTLMPDGLASGMSTREQADLVRFLMELRPASAEVLQVLKQSIATSGHGHHVAEFEYAREPLHPERWPNATAKVNRDRIYDFYAKEAEFVRAQPTPPHLVAAYPGLDGGTLGHWGNQDEEVWRDDRWSDTRLGSLQCGIVNQPDHVIARGVCVRLGENEEYSAVFNLDTLQYELFWKDGFVGFSPVRHGFTDGLKIEGNLLPEPSPQPIPAGAEYGGLYRLGKQVVFSYQVGETEYLDAAIVVNGKLTREIAPVNQHSLRQVLDGGPAQWPQAIRTPITEGTGGAYVVDTIALPEDNPWNALLFCGGIDFLSDGTAIVCTMQGDVWRVSGLSENQQTDGQAVWRRMASGLNQALGVVVDEQQRIFVQCRDQLVCLHDFNADGEADFYECVNKAFETSPAGHDFVCGLEQDQNGNFYTASGNQGLLRLSADGRRADVIAEGFRNPDGLGLLPDGTVTVPCSEGEWTPASMICAIPEATTQAAKSATTEVPFFGYRGPREGHPPKLPLAYLARGLDNSSGGQVYVNSHQWGPLQGQLLHTSFGQARLFAVLRDEVAGQPQGAVVPLPGDFLSGIHRGRFSPVDGQLYVCGMTGWGCYAPDDGCLQRVRYTGEKYQMPVGFHVHENGILVEFAQPLDSEVAQNADSQFAQCWNYHYSGAYGSGEFSPSHRGVEGHDVLHIASCHVMDAGRSLFIELPDLQPVNQLHLRLQVDSGEPQHLFVTVHQLDAPLTGFPGYRPQEKTIAAHPILTDLAIAETELPNPFRNPLPQTRRVEIETGKNLTFATRSFRVSPGEAIEFRLINPDVVPHNWALVRPGTLQRVGEQANRLVADPQAFLRQYIPQTDEVLCYTDIVDPGETFTIYFRAPLQRGRYPYLCTFPGHWMVMNGEMIVE